MKRPFHFKGALPASKSILNRLLIIQSFADRNFTIEGRSQCDDVIALHNGLQALATGAPIDCGAGAAVLRFLALRVSRISGEHRLTGTARLFERPIDSLIELLHQLGVDAAVKATELRIVSQGWRDPGKPIVVDMNQSSQFASALLLSAWGLPFDLEFVLQGEAVSHSYFRMTKAVVEQCGMAPLTEGVIPKGQRVRSGRYGVEPDMSCAFAVAALGAVAGSAEIEHFPKESLQPDAVFPQFLSLFGISCSLRGGSLHIQSPSAFCPVEWNFRETPDMFPLAGVLSALAQGDSRLHGGGHLTYKESHRIQKTAELIRLMGRKAAVLVDGLIVEGRGGLVSSEKQQFDPDEDHRLAMAAAVANAAGADIEILHPEVVNKSFPEFWTIAKGGML